MEPTAAKRTLKILLVEDDPGDARLVEEMLGEVGAGDFDLRSAADLASAKALLSAREMDVVLLDLSLSDSHGTDVVAAVRAGGSRLPIVVLAGLENQEVVYDAMKKGAQDYLVKGQFDSPVLTRTIRYAIQRKRLEDEVKHSISLLQATIESTADGIVVIDRAGKISNYNLRLLEMLEAPESILASQDGARLIEFLLAQLVDPERFRRRLQDLGAQEEQGYDLLEFRDGRIYERLSIPHALEGSVIGSVWTFRDVTERRQAIEDLRHARQAAEAANQAKSEFLADLNHEIRTPLSTIVGVADLLADTKLAADQQQYIEILRRSTQALLALVSDVLDLSKIEAGRLELERIPFSLPQVMTGVIDLLRPAAAQKGLLLSVDVPADVPAEVIGDPTRLRQILLNLASNAIKFTERGQVAVSVKSDSMPGCLHFTVTDTGIGIPRQNLATIFEKFRQVDASVQRHHGGSGLGLSIARRLVELMHGRIWVESEIGSGSRFHFVVRLGSAPRAAEAGPAKLESPGRASSPAAPAQTRARVLLADDSKDNRALIGFYLKKTPYDLDMADNGEVAVRKFQAGQYDVVIMDLQMPVLDGYEAVREIRRWEVKNRRAATPILALTAYAIDDKIEKSLAGGCSGVLTKPITREQLLAAIQSHVRAKSPAS